MSKNLILFIDEQADYRDEFIEHISDDAFEVKAIHPLPSEQELINYILDEKFDAVIVDYGLSRNDSNIKYSGGDVISKLIELKEDFPAFVLTRDIEQDGGVDEQVNSTMILLKDDLSDENKLKSLKRKIEKFIKLYKKTNNDLSNEYSELIKKRNAQGGKLNDKELETLNDLDAKIERRMLGKKKFPNLLKDSESLKHLNNVIKEAEEFLQRNLKK